MNQIIAARLTSAELERLDRIAQATGRNRSETLRLLIALAEPEEKRDVKMKSGIQKKGEIRA